MSAVASQLDKILDKTNHLIDLCGALQQENKLLRQENQQVKAQLNSAKVQLSELDESLRVLKLAKSIEGGTNEKTLDIKQKINEFVREIDKCVLLLKK